MWSAIDRSASSKTSMKSQCNQFLISLTLLLSLCLIHPTLYFCYIGLCTRHKSKWAILMVWHICHKRTAGPVLPKQWGFRLDWPCIKWTGVPLQLSPVELVSKSCSLNWLSPSLSAIQDGWEPIQMSSDPLRDYDTHDKDNVIDSTVICRVYIQKC